MKGGRILAVGTKEEVLKSKGDATKIIDLAGKTMLPGFVDAHGHVFMGGSRRFRRTSWLLPMVR